MRKSEYPDWLVPLELAKRLKEIGFDEECVFTNFYLTGNISFEIECNDDYYLSFSDLTLQKNMKDGLVTIPTWEQAFSWFRKKGYIANIDYVFHPDLNCLIGYLYEIIYDFNWEKYSSYYISYEIAREECLKDLISIYNGTNKR